jgi:hypothetical protein
MLTQFRAEEKTHCRKNVNPVCNRRRENSIAEKMLIQFAAEEEKTQLQKKCKSSLQQKKRKPNCRKNANPVFHLYPFDISHCVFSREGQLVSRQVAVFFF